MTLLRKLVALLVVLCGCSVAHAQAPLRVGDAFPPVTAKALNGGTLRVPDGHAAVVLVGFTQAAGKDSTQWTQRLAREFPAVPVDNLIFLDGVPGFVRGMIASGIRHGMTAERQSHSAVMDHDGALWRGRLATADTSHAVALVLDPGGHIRAIVSGPVTDSGYAAARAALAR